eukprot:1059401-Amphidinium_carterae.1
MSAVTHFVIHTNSFEGALPESADPILESGIQGMNRVMTFGIHTNSFEGRSRGVGSKRCGQ